MVRKLTDNQRVKLARMWMAQEKLEVIAATFNLTRKAVHNERVRQDLPKRTGRERYEQQAPK
jgi:hypothetical protein